MKALTALDTGGGDYAGAVKHLAETLPEPPRRGQIVEWDGETYRLNRRAVADIVFAHESTAQCDHIIHCHILNKSGKALAFAEHRPYKRDDGEVAIPCPEGHGPQLYALVLDEQEPMWCALCGETPEFYPVAQNLNRDLPDYTPDPVAWAQANL